MMRRPLSSRGFMLPAMPPKTGHPRRDDEWNEWALRRVLLAFLAPSAPLSSARDQGKFGSLGQRVIDQDSARHGFTTPHAPNAFGTNSMWRMLAMPAARDEVAAYIGVPAEEIWPRLHCWTHEHGARLEAAIRAAGLTHRAVAIAAKLNLPTLTAMLQGRFTPEPNNIKRICTIIGCDPDQILGCAPKPTGAQSSPWRRWRAATRDLLRWWWSFVA